MELSVGKCDDSSLSVGEVNDVLEDLQTLLLMQPCAAKEDRFKISLNRTSLPPL